MGRLTDTNDYDLIFAALKNPVRREILVFLEQTGEASFTDIQNTVNVNDTGLLSYHLKELNLLVEQSSRGKYNLSEIGQTSMVLFRKVELEQERTSKIVQKEVDSYLTKHFWSSLILAGLVIFSYSIPVSVDILVSVETIYSGFQLWHLASLHLLGLFGMTTCLLLFVVYDRHYHAKNLKTNIIHTLVFAGIISLVVLVSFYSTIKFTHNTIAMAAETANVENLTINLHRILVAVRTTVYVASAPVLAYVFDRLKKRH